VPTKADGHSAAFPSRITYDDFNRLLTANEAKNTYVTASERILRQAQKDSPISEATGKQAVWHLYQEVARTL
jgi:hypothetical protein